MAIILGIDPGSRITGYGVVDWHGNKVRFIDCGMIKPDLEQLQDRLQYIYHHIVAVIREFQPTEMAIEQVFLARNADSALKLGHARGVAIVSGMNQGLSVAEYSARQVKQSVVGKGAATKEQVQYMICRLLGLPESPQEDAADALGIALCHAFRQQGAIQLQNTSGMGRSRLNHKHDQGQRSKPGAKQKVSDDAIREGIKNRQLRFKKGRLDLT